MKINFSLRGRNKTVSKSGVVTDGYIAYQHPFDLNPSEVSRQAARDAFNYFILHKDKQISMLKYLLNQNGLKLSGDSDDIRAINKWINSSICLSETDFFVDADGNKKYYIDPDWSNIIFDLSIFVGDVIIQNTENVS